MHHSKTIVRDVLLALMMVAAMVALMAIAYGIFG